MAAARSAGYRGVVELEDELRTLLRDESRDLLLLEAAGYAQGFHWLSAEYPDDLADQVVEAILATAAVAGDVRVAQVPGRALIAVRDVDAEVVLADLAARIRALLPADSSVDAVRDGAR
jgi:hypothetical protein